MTRVWLAAVALLAGACGSPTGPSESLDLLSARTRWAARGGMAYSYEISRGCFCVLGGKRILVTVVGGGVTAAEDAESGAAVEQAFFTYLPTVHDLFDLIDAAIAAQAAALEVSYDDYFGHPTSIQIDYSAEAVDDELTLTVRGFQLTGQLQRRQ